MKWCDGIQYGEKIISKLMVEDKYKNGKVILLDGISTPQVKSTFSSEYYNIVKKKKKETLAKIVLKA